MRITLKDLEIGTFGDGVARVTYDTPWIQVLDMFVNKKISAVPIVDHNGKFGGGGMATRICWSYIFPSTDEVLDIYEKYDVIALAREGGFDNLDIPVGEAVRFRSTTDQNRVHTCTLSDDLYSLLEAIREAKVHRFVIVDEDGPADDPEGTPRRSRKLLGILTLTDLLAFLVGLSVPRFA